MSQPNEAKPIIRAFCGEEGIECLRMASIDEKAHTAEFVISSETPVRDRSWGNPTSLSMQGAVLKDYRANPVVLHQHQHGAPTVVGRSLKVGVEEVAGKKVLVARAQFDFEDEGLGKLVWGKIARGFLRAASIGFSPIRIRTVEAGQIDQATGLKGPVDIATQWRMAEWSVVAVGADGESLGRSPDAEPDPEAEAGKRAADAGRFVLPVRGFRLF